MALSSLYKHVFVKLDSGLWTGLVDWSGLWTNIWTEFWTEFWTNAELHNDYSHSESVIQARAEVLLLSMYIDILNMPF